MIKLICKKTKNIYKNLIEFKNEKTSTQLFISIILTGYFLLTHFIFESIEKAPSYILVTIMSIGIVKFVEKKQKNLDYLFAICSLGFLISGVIFSTGLILK